MWWNGSWRQDQNINRRGTCHHGNRRQTYCYGFLLEADRQCLSLNLCAFICFDMCLCFGSGPVSAPVLSLVCYPTVITYSRWTLTQFACCFCASLISLIMLYYIQAVFLHFGSLRSTLTLHLFPFPNHGSSSSVAACLCIDPRNGPWWWFWDFSEYNTCWVYTLMSCPHSQHAKLCVNDFLYYILQVFTLPRLPSIFTLIIFFFPPGAIPFLGNGES